MTEWWEVALAEQREKELERLAREHEAQAQELERIRAYRARVADVLLDAAAGVLELGAKALVTSLAAGVDPRDAARELASLIADQV